MAAAAVKSPLHNFPLTFLKWGSKKDQQRCRRTPYDSPPPQQSDNNGEGSEGHPSNSKQPVPVGSRSSRNRRNNNNNPSSSTPPPTTTPQTQTQDDETDEGKKPEAKEVENEAEVDKGWNLRPRRAAAIKGTNNNNNNNNNHHHHSSTAMVETTTVDGLPKSTRLRGLENQGNGGSVVNGGVAEKREKKKFWISLSRDEIEEDVYSMTGAKPSRRPKKRPKNVQKQLDNVFPGSWLIGVSPEAYRGLDVPPKVHISMTKGNCESFECFSACRAWDSIWRLPLTSFGGRLAIMFFISKPRITVLEMLSALRASCIWKNISIHGCSNKKNT